MSPTGAPLDAGAFGAWLDDARRAVRDGADLDVPCGNCTACCRSSQFVHIDPDETDTLAHLPGELLFPAPGLPAGHVLMGYDEDGRCPMLVDDACSIYEHRPRTCRTYDCRVLAAAGVDPADVDPADVDHSDEPDKQAIAERARRWRFTHRSDAERRQHEAVRAAATYLLEHANDLPRRSAPVTATHRALLAIEIHELFAHGAPEPAAVRVALISSRDGRRAATRPPSA